MSYNPARKAPRKLTDVKEPRYSIVRNTNRRTGECSWGIHDNFHHSNSNPVVHIADNLKGALEECARMNRPPEKRKYTIKRGMVGFIDPEEEATRMRLLYFSDVGRRELTNEVRRVGL